MSTAPATPDDRPKLTAEEQVRLVATTELMQRFQQAIKAARMYAPTHAYVVDFQKRAQDAALKLVHDFGVLQVDVHAARLTCFEQTVLEDDDPREGFCKALFFDGVQSVRFTPGLVQGEVVRFLQIWMQAVANQLPAEHGFFTACWEQEFAGIEVEAAETFQESDARKKEQALRHAEDQLVAQLGSRQAPVHSGMAGSTFDGQSLLEEVLPGGATDEDLASLEKQDLAPTGGLAPTELAELGRGLAEAVNSASLERALLHLWRLMGLARDDERKLLLGHAREALLLAMHQRQWAGIVRLAQLWSGSIRQEPARAVDAQALLAVLTSKEGSPHLVAGLSTATGLAEVKPLLAFVPRTSLREGIAWLGQIPAVEGRLALAQLLAPLELPLGALAPHVGRLTEADFVWLDLLMRGLHEADTKPLFEALLVHADPAVRIAALSRVPQKLLELLGTQMSALIADPDMKVRRAALATAVRNRWAPAMRVLVAQLDRENDANERRVTLRAIGQLGGQLARTTLLRVFEKDDDVQTRIVAAQLLGAMKDAAARPALEAVANKLFGDKALREACKAALAQLGGGA